jgi:hypothetical protein
VQLRAGVRRGTVAMRFDPYLREAQQKAQYSRVI